MRTLLSRREGLRHTNKGCIMYLKQKMMVQGWWGKVNINRVTQFIEQIITVNNNQLSRLKKNEKKLNMNFLKIYCVE